MSRSNVAVIGTQEDWKSHTETRRKGGCFPEQVQNTVNGRRAQVERPPRTTQEKAVCSKLDQDPGSSSLRLEICCQSRLTFEEGKSKKSVTGGAISRRVAL